MTGFRYALIVFCLSAIALVHAEVSEPDPEPKPPKVEPVVEPGLEEIVEIDAQGRIVRHSAGIQDPIRTRFAGLPIQYGEPVKGFRLGKDVVIHPLADVLVTYDDNVLGTRKAIAQDDVVGHFLPGFQVTYEPSRKYLVNLFYQFGWHDYFGDEAVDFLSHRGAFDFNIFDIGGIEGLDFGIRDRYHQTSNSGVLEDQFLTFRRLHGNTAGPFIHYERGRHLFDAEYEYGFVDYFARRDRIIDYDTHRGFWTYAHKVSSKIQPYVQYQYLNLNFDPGAGDFETHEGRAGVRLFYNRWSLDVNIGGIAIHSNERGGEDDSGIVTRAQLNYEFDRHFSLYAVAAFETQQGVLTAASETTTGEAGMTYRPTRKLRVDALVRWIRDDRVLEDQRTLQAGAGATYHVTRNFFVEGRYLHSNRDSDVRPDVEINQGTLGFHLRF